MKDIKCKSCGNPLFYHGDIVLWEDKIFCSEHCKNKLVAIYDGWLETARERKPDETNQLP